jgi:hypothetical protein
MEHKTKGKNAGKGRIIIEYDNLDAATEIIGMLKSRKARK